MRPAPSKESIAAAMKAALADVPIEDILQGVVSVLEHFIAQSEQVGASLSCERSDFDQKHICVNISAYLNHIVRSGLCSKECFIIALIYVERILQRVDGFAISRRNVHCLMLVNLMLASKMLDDFYCRNKYYASTGGLELEVLNDLELKTCFMMGFDLNVTVKEFELYRDSLRRDESHVQADIMPSSLDTWPVGTPTSVSQVPPSHPVMTRTVIPQAITHSVPESTVLHSYSQHPSQLPAQHQAQPIQVVLPQELPVHRQQHQQHFAVSAPTGAACHAAFLSVLPVPSITVPPQPAPIPTMHQDSWTCTSGPRASKSTSSTCNPVWSTAGTVMALSSLSMQHGSCGKHVARHRSIGARNLASTIGLCLPFTAHSGSVTAVEPQRHTVHGHAIPAWLLT